MIRLPLLWGVLLVLQDPGLAKLKGNWVMDFRPARNSGSTNRRGTATLELDIVTVPRVGRVVEGPYTLAMAGLTRPDPCMTLQGKARLVRLGAHSIKVDFHQGFGCGLQVSGVVRGDSVVGKWFQRSARGTVASGTFVMTRPRG
jgi:hypothetical protein